MLVALAISILFSLAVGILAARNKKAESILIPLLDVFQSIPILGFFPIVILGIIAVFPSQIGVNLAVILLIFTSMAWNLAFGVYEAVKSIPQDYIDVSYIPDVGSWRRIITIYIPSSLNRISYNSETSWAVGLFYLISSEILTLGSSSYTVDHGIGFAIMRFASLGDWSGYTYAIIALIVAVIIWQYVFLREFALWSEKYKFVEEPIGIRKDRLLRFYSWVNQRSISKLFLLTHLRGVTRFSSTLTRFKSGVKYSVLIAVLTFAALEVSALLSKGPLVLSDLPSLATIVAEEGSVLKALFFSFLRVWYVYFISVAVGLPIGISIALNPELYNSLSALLEVAASLPAPALLPLIVVATAHQGEAVAGIIIFLGMIWYLVFNIMSGIRSLPKEVFELRSEFRVTRRRAWRDIYLPATFTALVTGSISAVGGAWNTLIVAEYFSVQAGNPLTQVGSGIGKTIAIATNDGDLLSLTLSVVSMTILILVFDLTVWRRV